MTFARAAYTLLVVLAMPLAALYLLWRSRRQPAYRAHWGERFGWSSYAAARSPRPQIWIHAVSVGETRAAEPLLAALAERFPGHDFLLTHMTPTGRATGAELAARWPGRVRQVYLPYDLPFAVGRFLRAAAPVVGIGMETETWPNLLAQARAGGIPLVLANARLSERSLRRAQRAPTLFRDAARCFTAVLAQTEADAERMRRVGAERVEVIGNLKFDLAPNEELVARGRAFRASAGQRAVLLFASTREGEEALLLAAIDAVSADWGERVLAIFVPRHPQRFDEVAALLAAGGRPVVRRSAQATWSAVTVGEDAFVLGDSMGELAMYYAACDVAYVGGSLLPLGGQNLIEACAVGTPVVVGPHTFNFAQATDDAVAAGAALRAADAAGAVAAMHSIAADPARRTQMSEAALQFARQHRGATARAVARIAPLVEAAAQRRA
jgi:3-deoxy-D-manno-octulosonic-acid transferase